MPRKVAETYQALLDRVEREIDRRDEASKTRIQVGAATCENASGARSVMEEFRKHIETAGRDDILLRRTGCTGRCSREPIVGVLVPGEMPVKYQHVDAAKAHRIFVEHVLRGNPPRELVLDGEAQVQPKYEVFFCSADRCGAKLKKDLRGEFEKRLAQQGVGEDQCEIVSANCFGLCRAEMVGEATHMLVRPSKTVYRVRDESELDEIIDQHIRRGQVVQRLAVEEQPISQRFFQLYGDQSFFNRQSRLALRNSGIVDPEDLFEYVHFQGFAALAAALERGDRQWVIDEITGSKLRGRGGGGYPTGKKWANAAGMDADEKFIICNADEGDPGAFMDRSMLEGDPLSVIEGMAIGAYAIGASRGFFYVRAEYPLAIRRIENALEQCREHGLLGEDILGSGFDFDIEVRLGAGAFVCGEETALIHSIEGLRGQPRIRPPYPTTKGLWGKPTVINNVETLANVPVVLEYGAEWFAQVGTENSGGTKVFALAGKVNHTGLVEVPMGTTLREIVYDIGGGVPEGRELKAIQTGGPAGGCIPAKWIETPVDFDTLSAAGSIMGSGGMIVMDESDCMVDIAKFFLTFSQDESCGKCTPCREGTTRMLEILQRITAGDGEPEDLCKLRRLGALIRKSSLCGLGRAAPNPVLSTLEHFEHEYRAHVEDKVCPAGKCPALKGARAAAGAGT